MVMTQPQVKCEECKRVEIAKDDDRGSPYVAAKRRLRKRCTRAGHTSLPILIPPHEIIHT